MIILIYFSGTILSFLFGRYTYRMMCEEDHIPYNYGLAIVNLSISFLSWISVAAWLVVYLINKPKNTNNKLPPKWM